MTPRNIPIKMAYADWLAKSSAQSPTSSDPASPTPPTPTTPRRRGARAGRNQRYQPFDYTAVETPPPEVPSQSTEPQPSHESSANEGVPLHDEQKIAAEGDDQNQRLASNSREVTPERQGSIQPTLTSPSQTTAVDPDLTSSQEQPPQTPAVNHDLFHSQEQPLQTTAVDPDLTSPQEQLPQTPAVDPDLFSAQEQLPQTAAVDYDQTASQEQRQADCLHQQSPVTPVKSTYSQAAQKNLPLRPKDPVSHTHSQAAQQTPRRRPSAIHTSSQAAQQRHHRRTSADYTQGQAAYQGHHRRTSADFIPGQAAHQSHQRRTFADYTRGQPARAAHQGHHRRTSADFIQGQAAYQDHHRRTSADFIPGQAAHQSHQRRTFPDFTQGQPARAAHRAQQRRTSANYDYEQGFQQTAYQPADLDSSQASIQGQQQHTIPQANLHEHPHPQASRYHPVLLPDLPQPLEFPTPEAHTYSELYGGYFSKQDLRYIHHVYDSLSQQAFFALHNMPFNEPPSSSVPSSAMPSSAAPSTFNDAASSTSNESMDKYAWARGMVARERARERAEQDEERMQAEAAQFTQSSPTPHAYGSQLHSRQTSGTSYHSGTQQARPAFGPHPSFTTQHGTPRGTPRGTPTTAAAMPSMASTSGNTTPTATPAKPKMIHLAPDVPVSNDSWPVFRLALAARLQLLQKEAQEYEDRVRRNAALEKQQQQAAGARGGHARKGSWLKEKGGAMHRVEDQTFGGLPFGTTGEQQEQQRKSSADDSIAASMAQLTLANIAAGKVDISKRQLMAFSDEELFGSFGFKAPGPEQVQDLFNRYQALLLAPAAAAAPAAAPVLPGPGLGFGVATPAAVVVVPAAGAVDQHFLADTYSAHGGPRLPAEHVSRALRAGGPFVPAPGAPGPAPRPVVKSSVEAKPAVSAVAPARKKETFVPGVSGACFGTFDRSVWNGSQLPRELRRGGEEKKGEEGKEKGEKKKKEEMGFLPGLGFDQV